ncbi:hypothetical protein K470DRAFT_265655 [Piedraia hortae CBS 480.64]|uniref:Uncharacterized protein n=1 Tax=Piedraia hortae CBS 480.64 TaxID=1314780 RepID=A0A6A7BVD2_9PEZI|nr:hypothetical protein K470DRAFT_265655 [Piedraia hortae CBS 480.64]
MSEDSAPEHAVETEATAQASVKTIAVRPSTPEPSPSNEKSETEAETPQIAPAASVDTLIKRRSRVLSTAEEKEEEKLRSVALLKCEGNPTGFGTSSIAPQYADLDKPWRCGNPMCSTGMTYHSHRKYQRNPANRYFGGSRFEANMVPGKVRHTFCRKCYQHAERPGKVKSREPEAKRQEAFKLAEYYIEGQLLRYATWRPQAKFKIRMNKSINDRYREYQRCLARHNNDHEAAIADYSKPGSKYADRRRTNLKKQKRNLTNDEAFPLNYMEEFKEKFCTEDPVDYEIIMNTLEKIRNLFEKGVIPQMPPVWFIMGDVQIDEQLNDEDGNYRAWMTHYYNNLEPAAQEDEVQSTNAAKARGENEKEKREEDVEREENKDEEEAEEEAEEQRHKDFDIEMESDNPDKATGSKPVTGRKRKHTDSEKLHKQAATGDSEVPTTAPGSKRKHKGSEEESMGESTRKPKGTNKRRKH